MRLFEAILDANHRALAGDTAAGVRPADFPDALPVVALTCVDPRLNHLFPEALGVHEDDFIWLRNAGNIIFEPMSSMVRSLSLACAVKGGKEIAIIGHSDCRVRQMSVSQLIECFRGLGINRASLPDNLIEFFGMFASEHQNVINGVNHVRQSPLISPKIPVHGLMVDVQTGRLEWVVNGYEHLGKAAPASPLLQKLEHVKDEINALANFKTNDLQFPQVKIGDLVIDPAHWKSEVQTLKQAVKEALPGGKTPRPAGAPPPTGKKATQPILVPPPIQALKEFTRKKK
jgi:carbonic anhydrase